MNRNNFKKWLILINTPTVFLVADLIYSWFHFQSLDVAKMTPSTFQTKFIIESIFCLSYFPISIFVYRSLKKEFEQTSYQFENEKSAMLHKLDELTKYSEQLTRSSGNAASSMEQTVASLEELNSMVQLNSEHAKQAAALSQNSRDTAIHGEQEINLLIQSMREISDSSKKVQEITYLIDDISFQTNLLALNAAVEAARAGEQGRGFAVVADAVRNLAQKSAVAAKDIANLINETTTKVDKGFSQANNSGEVLKKILTSVKMVSDLNNEISLASQEQTVGLNQISQAMNVIAQSLQSNNSTMKDLTAKVSELQNAKPELPLAPPLKQNEEAKNTAPTEKAKKAVAHKPVAKPAKNPTKATEKAPSVAHMKSTQKTEAKTPSPVDAATATKTESNPAAATASKPKLAAVKSDAKPASKAEELIPFDEDLDRVKLAKAEDF